MNENVLETINETNNRDVTIASESQRATAETNIAFAMAIKRPRSEANALALLTKTMERKSFCEKAIYVFPRGGENITGPSVNLARELSRLWGNIQFGYKIIQDDMMTRTIEGFAWDLENNTKITEPVTFKKIREKKDKGGILTSNIVSERDVREITGVLQKYTGLKKISPRK